MPIPIAIILAAAAMAANQQAESDEQKRANAADVTFSNKSFEQEEWRKKHENEKIDEQRRNALARTLQTKYNRLPDQLQLYPEIRREEVRPSGWRTAAGALRAAVNINWDSFKNPTTGV